MIRTEVVFKGLVGLYTAAPVNLSQPNHLTFTRQPFKNTCSSLGCWGGGVQTKIIYKSLKALKIQLKVLILFSKTVRALRIPAEKKNSFLIKLEIYGTIWRHLSGHFSSISRWKMSSRNQLWGWAEDPSICWVLHKTRRSQAVRPTNPPCVLSTQQEDDQDSRV